MARIREVELADLEAVGALTRTVGWGVPTAQSWQRLWQDNPALNWDGPQISKGWVLEDGSRIVGFLCNLAQLYQLGDRTLRTAVAGSLVVHPDFRGSSMQLATVFVRQSNVDLLLNTTAALQASKIFQFLKFQRIPQADYDRSYYWVLREAAFLRAGLRKKGFATAISRAGGVFLAPLLWAEKKVRGRGPRFHGGHLTIKVIGAEKINSDFDELWQCKVAERQKLLAFRTAEILRWHYGPEGKTNPPFLVCAYDRARLVGYLSVVRQDAPHIQLHRARVADIFVERDAPDVICQLLEVAARRARAGGADMLEVVGFPEHIRRVLRMHRPFELQDKSWPFLYKAVDPELHQTLASAVLWHACLFDGDGSL